MAEPKSKKKKAGRPKLPDRDRARSVNASLRADLYRWVSEVGSGTPGDGVRRVLDAAYRGDFGAIPTPKSPTNPSGS